MNISKSDFKKIYNLTKNFNVTNYQNLVSEIENNVVVNDDIKYVIDKNGKDEIINTLNKLNNFSYNKKYNLKENSEENKESIELINNFTNFISKDDESSSDLNLTNINWSEESLNEEPMTSATSFNVDYDYMNQEVINTETSVTSEDNNVFQQSNEISQVNYNDVNDLVNSLLDSEVDTIQTKNINKKYLSQQKDIDSILNMF
jgi:mannose-6-phosphate isomerase class I